MQLFANNLRFDSLGRHDSNGSLPRLHFDDFPTAFLTIFTILIGDDWFRVMYNCMLGGNQFIAAFYFITIILFGQIIMINLFLAILLGNFDSARSELKKEEKMEQIEDYLSMKGITIECALEIVLGDLGRHIIKHVLKKSPHKLPSEMSDEDHIPQEVASATSKYSNSSKSNQDAESPLTPAMEAIETEMKLLT